MDWKMWLGEYKRVSPMAFEKWLFTHFRKRFRSRTVIKLTVQDLLHISLWKLGHRQLGNVATNKEIPRLRFPGPGLARREDHEIEEAIQVLMPQLAKLNGFGVPTASAILTVLRPKAFSPIDKYALRGLKACLHQLKHQDHREVGRLVRKYENSGLTAGEYATYLITFWKLRRLYRGDIGSWSLRDIDRALWAYGSSCTS